MLYHVLQNRRPVVVQHINTCIGAEEPLCKAMKLEGWAATVAGVHSEMATSTSNEAGKRQQATSIHALIQVHYTKFNILHFESSFM